MSKSLTFCIFCLIPLSLWGQYILSGIVTYQNSGSRPVIGAEVSALWANNTTTDENGRFQLIFTGKRAGSRVSLEVLKPSFEVVNKKDLEHTLKADSRRAVKFYLCPKGEWERNAIKYYRINEEVITRKYKREVDQVKKSLQNNMAMLLDSLNRMEQLYKLALNQAERLSEQFAVANLDDADSLYVAAFEQFRLGNIDSAIMILDDTKLDKNMQDALQVKKDGEMLVRRGQDKKDNAAKAKKKLAQQFFLRWQIERSENMEETNEKLRIAFKLDSLNEEIRLHYAQVLASDSVDKARRLVRSLIENPSTKLPKNLLWEELLVTYDTSNQRDQVLALMEEWERNARPTTKILLDLRIKKNIERMGFLALTNGDFSEAERLALKLLKRNKRSVRGNSYYELSLLLQDRWKESKQHLKKLKQDDDFWYIFQEELLFDILKIEKEGISNKYTERLKKSLE